VQSGNGIAQLRVWLKAKEMVMAWWNSNKDEMDDELVEAHKVVLDGLSDADKAHVIDVTNDRDKYPGAAMRDQLTVEEAEAIRREYDKQRGRWW
jgi:hypothetical protein